MHEHEGHDHGHPAPRFDADDTRTYYQVMETAVRVLLIEKGVLSAEGSLRALMVRAPAADWAVRRPRRSRASPRSNQSARPRCRGPSYWPPEKA